MQEKPDILYIKIVEFSLNKIDDFFEEKDNLFHEEFTIVIENDIDTEYLNSYFKQLNVKVYTIREAKKIFSSTCEPKGLTLFIANLGALKEFDWVQVKFTSSLNDLYGTLYLKFSSLKEPYTIDEEFNITAWYSEED
ncbi:MAG: hypothetical protein IPK25_14895 [Saprospiraceae bacterium]|nr:hypothetical protein [Saprospiraceae bacterium]